MTQQDGEKRSTKLAVVIILVVALIALIGFIVFKNVTADEEKVTAWPAATVAVAAQDSGFSAPLSDAVFAVNDQHHEPLVADAYERAQVNAGCMEVDESSSFGFVYRDLAGTLTDVATYSVALPILSEYETLAGTHFESSCLGSIELVDDASFADFSGNTQATIISALTRVATF